MTDQIPGPVRAIAKVTRTLIGFLGGVVSDEAQMRALRAELGLPYAPYDAASAAQTNAKLKEIDGKLAAGDEMADDDFAGDNEILELLVHGEAMTQLIQIGFQGRYDGDVRTVLDIGFDLFGILAMEWMRVKHPVYWVGLRLLTAVYAHQEETYRLNPFKLFDQLTGADTDRNSFGATDFAVGFGVPVFVIVLNQLIDHFSELEPEDFVALPNGRAYYTSDISFKMGWDPDPDSPIPALELLERSGTVRIAGTQKIKGTNESKGMAALVGFTYFEDPVEGAGFLIRLGGDVAETLDLAPNANTKKTMSFAASGGGGIDLWWTSNFVRFLGPVGDGNFRLTADYDVKGSEQLPSFRFGKSGKSRFDIAGWGLHGALSQNEQAIGLKIEGGKLVLFPSEIVPALADVFEAVGAEKFEAKIEGSLKLSNAGLAFEGEAGLKIRLASSLKLGVARLDYVDIELGVKDKDVMLGIEAAGRFAVGPFAASIDRFGIAILPFKGDFKFLPPKGIGLRIDGGVVKGGGYLMLDYEAQEFAGALELTLLGFSVKAIAILSTGGPGTDAKFALFVLIYMRFPGGLELGLRFTLNALGGMVGVNHDFDENALIAALPNGAMDDVLFPDDPVGDAPRIIASLKTIFPVKDNVNVIGVMAEVGWGSDYFCSLRLGIIIPFDSRIGHLSNDGFDYVYILGRMQVVCFEGVPKPIRLQLMCDIVAHVGYGLSGINIGVYARLRDSRFGPTSIEGAIAFNARTGPDARFILAAGGFHPAFTQIPQDLPSPIDRIGVSYDIGVIQAWAKGYFAVASGSLQFGLELGIRYKLGPIGLRAQLGLDALIHLDPFSFRADARATAAVTYRGHELLGVHLNLTICGPDRWSVKGHGEFKILFWDVDVDVDESWGDDVALPPSSVRLDRLVADDLDNPTNWKYSLPSQGNMMVTINTPPSPTNANIAIAHPLAGMSYTQRRVPFGLNLERVSFCAIDGPTLFPVPKITVGEHDEELAGATILTDQFAVPEFLNLTDDQKLSRPSFETLPGGIAVGAAGYRAPNPLEVEIECELIYKSTLNRRDLLPLVALEALGMHRFTAFEAAARSPLRPLPGPKGDPVLTKPVEWVVADRQTLRVTAAPGAAAWASHSLAAMTQLAGGQFDIVEAYEAAA